MASYSWRKVLDEYILQALLYKHLLYKTFQMYVFKHFHLNLFGGCRSCIFHIMVVAVKNRILNTDYHDNLTGACRIHQLHLRRMVRPNSTRVLYMTVNNLIARDLGNVEYPFIAIAPKFSLTWSVSTWQDLIYGSNRTMYLCKKWLMLNCDCHTAILGLVWFGFFV